MITEASFTKPPRDPARRRSDWVRHAQELLRPSTLVMTDDHLFPFAVIKGVQVPDLNEETAK